MSEPLPVLDPFDRAILRYLQRDNTTPLRVLADNVNLSAAAVQRRIRRLERDGVIRANVAIVEPRALGRSLTVLVEVTLHSERTAEMAAVKERFAAAPEVQQCYCVTGDTDFVLILLVASMHEYEALTRKLFLADGNIAKFRTIAVLDPVKVSLNVSVGD